MPPRPNAAEKRRHGRLGLPKVSVIDLADNIKLEMVLIPAGTFLMGSPPTEKYPGYDREQWPQHQVTISKPFYLCATENTHRTVESRDEH